MEELLKKLVEKVSNPNLYNKREQNKVLIESFFKKNQSFDEFLNESIQTIFDENFALWEQNLLKEDMETEERVLRFPKVKITENWGKVDNEDRLLLETLMANIKGGTVEEKIQSVSEFIDYKPDLSIPVIMSHLMFLEIFSSIIDEYNAATAGFLFEAFLAGIFAGTQVDDPEQVGASPGSLPIEDVRLAIREKDEVEDKIVPYSLKVLSPGTELKGSFVNLVDYFADISPDRYNDAIVYLVVTKRGQGTLSFDEFTITAENWMDYIGHMWYEEIGVEKETAIDGKELISLLKLKPIKSKKEPEPKYLLSSKKQIQQLEKFLKKSLKPDQGFEATSEDIKLIAISADPNYLSPNRIGDAASSFDTTLPGAQSAVVIYPDEPYNIRYTGTEKDLRPKGDKLTANGKKLYGDIGVINTLHKTLKSDKTPGYQKFWKTMRQTRGYKNNEQFHISPKYYRHPKLTRHLGEIDLYKPRLIKLANKYAQDLTAELINIYNALDALSMNINRYFLTSENNKQYGRLAVQDSKILYDNTKKAVGIK